jgi:hypothetical protein
VAKEPKNENTDSNGPAKPANNHVNIAEQFTALNAHVKSFAKELNPHSPDSAIFCGAKSAIQL